MGVDNKNAEFLNIKLIEAPAAPGKRNKLYGHNMRGV